MDIINIETGHLILCFYFFFLFLKNYEEYKKIHETKYPTIDILLNVIQFQDVVFH